MIDSINRSEDSHFVCNDSIVKEIWGKSDTVLFIFAGAAAEFALNKAVDWLYFTGKLPKDPIGRLFSTVTYAKKIVFSKTLSAHLAIDSIAAIHSAVETKRGAKIPDWAYRDVLYMLIDYSIRAYEVLERKLSETEKTEVFDVFYRVGHRMGIQELPRSFSEWKHSRQIHLGQNLKYSDLTKNLFIQYKNHLGLVRYRVMIETQKLICPKEVQNLLRLNNVKLIIPVIFSYKVSRLINLDSIIKAAILPKKYLAQIKTLDSDVT